MVKKYSLHILIAGLAGLSIFLPGPTTAFFQTTSQGFLQNFDGVALAITSLSLIFCVVLVAGPWGRLIIGGKDAQVEFSTRSWIAMLFAAGMGSGIVFWGAAEPVILALSPPPGALAPTTPEAIQQSYALTMFHWGLHAWAIYAVVALAIGYMARKYDGAPLPSVVFRGLPFWARRTIDWTALLAVTFGVVASLGQGAINMGAGAEIITQRSGIDNVLIKVVILVVLLSVYLFSAWRGLKGGIEPLSNFNMGLALLLLCFVFATGPTLGLVTSVIEMGGSYVRQLIPLSLELRPEGEAREWTRAWSLTYFLWWVAWTPFVGVFIARISHGRSIRAFILGVVLVPSFVTLIWFGVFGGAAIDQQLVQGIDLGVTDFATAPSATYVLMEALPLTLIMQILTFVLIFTFLVTSADSGAYVMAMFSSRAPHEPPRFERMFWGVILALLAIGAILSAQGQNATRALAVVGAIPLLFLMLAQSIALMRQVWLDWRAER